MRYYQRARRWGTVLAILAAGCEYRGAGGGVGSRAYDYSMAASPQWVVSMANDWGRATHTWNPISNDGPDLQTDMDGTFYPRLCPFGMSDGMQVVHSVATARFFYVGWGGGTVCLVSAPDSAPFSIDRHYDFSINEFQISQVPDQPHIAVSADKIVLTLNSFDNPNGPHTNMLVLSLAEVVQGIPRAVLHAMLVVTPTLASIAPLVPASAPNYDVFWTRPGPGTSITIGRIRGVPDLANVRTVTGTIGDGGSVLETEAVESGDSLYTAAVLAGNVLEIHRVTDVLWDDSVPFQPRDIGGQRTATGPLRGTSAVGVHDLSVSASPNGYMAVGWVTGGVPHYAFWTWNGCFATGVVDPNVSWDGGRRDFLPVGAAFFQSGINLWWVGIGWGDGTARWTYMDGQHSVFLREDNFPRC